MIPCHSLLHNFHIPFWFFKMPNAQNTATRRSAFLVPRAKICPVKQLSNHKGLCSLRVHLRQHTHKWNPGRKGRNPYMILLAFSWVIFLTEFHEKKLSPCHRVYLASLVFWLSNMLVTIFSSDQRSRLQQRCTWLQLDTLHIPRFQLSHCTICHATM